MMPSDRCTSRRIFLTGLHAAGALWATRGFGDEADAIQRKTCVYKSVDRLDIHADILWTGPPQVRPAVVWIHGGALIVGSRRWVDGRIRQRLLQAGYAVVSIDYRLAPETRLPEIVQDVQDALQWIRHEAPREFPLDTRRLVVMGSSAGGYLALTTGHRAAEPPQAIVSFWGYGDLIGDWYSRPSHHARHQQIKLSRDEAYRQVGGRPIADSDDRAGDGGAFYQYCRQHGHWPLAVSGWDPASESERFRPYMPLCNVTSDFPPTLLIHGTDDTDVPCQQSIMMAEKLRQADVEHRLITIDGGEHGPQGSGDRRYDAAYDAALEFVVRHAGRFGESE